MEYENTLSFSEEKKYIDGLNPCFNGTLKYLGGRRQQPENMVCLNPCFNGIRKYLKNVNVVGAGKTS